MDDNLYRVCLIPGIVGGWPETLATESGTGSGTTFRRGKASGRPKSDRRLDQRQKEKEHQSRIRVEQRSAGQSRHQQRGLSLR